MALCVGAVLGPVAGLVIARLSAPLAFVGAACALMSLVLASAHLHDKV